MATFKVPGISIKLSGDGSAVSEDIQLFRTGTFHHAEYGKFQITADMLKKMAENFKNQVRGVDLAVDYMHASEDVAAGWIKEVYLTSDGQELWAKVDWTPGGKRVLSDKEFRYISPEFMPDYKDNESLKSYGPTLMGAGLTNRPTIKRMEPVVELTEGLGLADQLDACAKDWIPKLVKEGKPQDQAVAIAYSKCRKELGIESADPTETEKRLIEGAQQKIKPNKGVVMDYKAMDPAALDAMSPEDLKALVLELMKKLEAGAADQKAMGDKVAAMEKKEKESEKKNQFAKLLAEGKVVAAQEESFLSGDMVKFSELSGKTNDGKGSATEPEPVKIETKDQAVAEVQKLAEGKLQKKEAKDLASAISTVLSERKDLNDKIYA